MQWAQTSHERMVKKLKFDLELAGRVILSGDFAKRAYGSIN